MSISEEFNFGEDSDGLWYVAIGNEQIVWDLSQEQAEKACTQLKAATSASDARYQARVRELEEALAFYAERKHFNIDDEYAWDTVSGEPPNFWCDEAGTATVEDGSVAKHYLSPTTPDTALQKALLEREISALQQFEHYHTSVHNQIVELRAQLAALGE